MKAKTAFAAVFIFLMSSSAYAENAPGARQTHVIAFYRWYLQQTLDRKDPVFDEKIYAYVDPLLIEQYRNDLLHSDEPVHDADYFTRSQDIPETWLPDVPVRDEITITQYVGIIPVDFPSGSSAAPHCLLVFVSVESGKPKIIKVNLT